MRHARRSRGFTLTEAMVVVALLAVVAAIAMPSFRSLIGTMDSRSVAYDLLSDLSAARSEAIKRNATTTIAPVSSNWSNGWSIKVGAQTLRQRKAPGDSLTIGAPAAGLVFAPNGRPGAEIDEDNLAWAITSAVAGVSARCVIVTPTGSARLSNGGC